VAALAAFILIFGGQAGSCFTTTGRLGAFKQAMIAVLNPSS
jgi:hypothetical protein